MFERNPPPARRPWEKPRRSSRRDRGDRDRPRRSYRPRYDEDYERPQYDDFHDRMHNSSVFDPQIYKTDPGRMPYDRITTDNHRNYEGYSSPYVHREPVTIQKHEESRSTRLVYNEYHEDSKRDRFYGSERDTQAPDSSASTTSADEKEGSRLFVQNLPTFYEESHLTQLFSSYGEITAATVQRDKKGKSIGTAFVTFRKNEDALRAIEALDEVMLSTQTLKIRQM